MLKQIFSSKVRVKILEYFFFHPGEKYYVRELASLIDEQLSAVSRELINLEKTIILRSEKIGNQKHYMHNEQCPILSDLRNIFLKTTGASQEIKRMLEKFPNVELAFIYGSYAKGDAGLTSDLDLMIVGEISDKDLAVAIAKVERKLKREINYTVYPKNELHSRIGKVGDFIHEVFTGPKIFLIGEQNHEIFHSAQ